LQHGRQDHLLEFVPPSQASQASPASHGSNTVPARTPGGRADTRQVPCGIRFDAATPRGSNNQSAEDTSAASAAPDIGVGAATSAESSLLLVPIEGFSTPLDAGNTDQPRSHTRLQEGIRKPKIYTDDIVCYGCFVQSDETRNLDDALANKNWKTATDSEYDALMKNITWHLVPP
jgi:hypothetical protein